MTPNNIHVGTTSSVSSLSSWTLNQIANFQVHSNSFQQFPTIKYNNSHFILGGCYSLIETKDRVEKKIPIVVMMGTGRAADLIGTAKELLVKSYDGNVSDSR